MRIPLQLAAEWLQQAREFIVVKTIANACLSCSDDVQQMSARPGCYFGFGRAWVIQVFTSGLFVEARRLVFATPVSAMSCNGFSESGTRVN